MFVGWFMSYLRYLCLLTYSGVQHQLCCVFVLFVFVLCTVCCQFLWIVDFLLPLRYYLTLIQRILFHKKFLKYFSLFICLKSKSLKCFCFVINIYLLNAVIMSENYGINQDKYITVDFYKSFLKQ